MATACVFCGDCVKSSTHVLMRNKRTHALVTVMLSDCPSQPAKLRCNTLTRRSASSPCSKHPLRCPLCTKTIWSYYMAQQYADVHNTARHPDLMHIADAEQQAMTWVPHKTKEKSRAMYLCRLMMLRVMYWPPPPLAMLPHCVQACLPCLHPNIRCMQPRSQVSPRPRPPGLSHLVLLKAWASATRRGGTKPSGSFIRNAPG